MKRDTGAGDRYGGYTTQPQDAIHEEPDHTVANNEDGDESPRDYMPIVLVASDKIRKAIE